MSEDPQALGQRLKAERERRGISTQKIANGMHLDAWVIDALEAGDHERIGPAVYARGHLKKYASLLGVSLAAPAAESPAAGAAVVAPATLVGAPAGGAHPGGAGKGGAYPPPIVRLDAPPSEAAWPRIGAVAAVAILAGGIFWWREAHRSAPAVPAPRTSQAVGSTGNSAEGEPQVAATGAESGDSAQEPGAAAMTAARAARAAVAVPAATAAAPTPPAADSTPGVGKARLRLSFSANSWVSIHDHTGRRVFEGNGRANSVKTIVGMAPFRVDLQSASGVQLQLNDRAVAIGRQFISGDEARFVAGADGVLRRDPPAPAANVPQTAAVSPHD